MNGRSDEAIARDLERIKLLLKEQEKNFALVQEKLKRLEEQFERAKALMRAAEMMRERLLF